MTAQQVVAQNSRNFNETPDLYTDGNLEVTSAFQQFADVDHSLALVQLLARRYFDGDTDAAWAAITVPQQVTPDLVFVSFEQAISDLVLSIANAYYDSNVEEAFSALEAAFVFNGTREQVIAGLSGR